MSAPQASLGEQAEVGSRRACEGTAGRLRGRVEWPRALLWREVVCGDRRGSGALRGASRFLARLCSESRAASLGAVVWRTAVCFSGAREPLKS